MEANGHSKNMDNTQTQLDPQAVNLTKAIRQSESGGNFQAKGASGEYGAYQYTEPTWDKLAAKYGVNSSLKDSTPEQQNEIAYKQIKEWKDSGKNVGQIASMWNAGEGEPDAYTGKFSNGQSSAGTNKEGVKFNVPAYAQSVANAYKTLKGGGQVQADPNNPSNTSEPSYFQDIENIKAPTSPQQSDTTAPGNMISNFSKGDIGGGISSGIRDFGNFVTGGGSEQLGKYLGTHNAINNAGNNAKYVDTTGGSTGDLVSGGLKTAGGIASVIGGGEALQGAKGLVSGLINRGSALVNPAVAEATGLSTDVFKGLSAIQKVTKLKDAMQFADEGTQVLLQKAMQEASSQVPKDAGVGSFSELNPVKAKALKLAWKGLKGIGSIAGLGSLGYQIEQGLLGKK